MVIEYFTNMEEDDVQKLLEAYYEALESNSTTFDFDSFNVSTKFANYILKYNNIDIKDIK